MIRVNSSGDQGAGPDDGAGVAPSSKAQWRKKVLRTRADTDPATRSDEANEIARLVGELAEAGATVCAYVPFGSEPGSIGFLDALREGGARVLLPVTLEPGPLHWGEYSGGGSLIPARYGMREPRGNPLPPAAIATADIVIVPALAVDRRGVRLGRGAGFYDRTLGLARANARLVAIVRDDELVERLPEEPHDKRMHAVIAPGSGLVQLAWDLG